MRYESLSRNAHEGSGAGGVSDTPPALQPHARPAADLGDEFETRAIRREGATWIP